MTKTEDKYIFESPIGLLCAKEEDGKLTELKLSGLKEEYESPRNKEKHSEILYETQRQVEEYFSGKRKIFDLPIALKGTDFQRKVWGELRKIPYGETRSYQDIALAVGNKNAVRAVGSANGKNPILLIVPCHRVIQKNGGLGGFACGIEIKKYILTMEQKRV